MATTTNVLDDARAFLGKRLAQLDDEHRRLERALAALDGGAPARRDPAPPTRPARAKRQPPRRRKDGRAAQAVRLIQKNPGIGAAEIGKKMKMKSNHIYTVLGELAKEGRVRKDGRKYFPLG